ncbi:MAG: insulinase family protein [Candidatus Binatia bacterium]|nr:insulinase family protein [Candidatus Binatia bacterium]
MLSWFILGVVLLASPLAALARDLSYSSRVQEYTLANGLKVLLLEDHKAPVTVFQVWYRVGSRNEELGKTGLSHLLEHLMFKGTEKRGPEEYSRIIQRNGGNENAFTDTDNTTYFATIASDRLDVVLDLEADRMENLKFDEEHFVPEHQVVVEERRLRTEDNPASALFELLSATAFTAHPYQWPIIGWMNDLRQATREDALAYYRSYYAPNNAFVVAVGDFSAEQLRADIERWFGPVPAKPAPPPVRAQEPAQQGERRATLRRPAELPMVALAFHVPNLRHSDAFALEVLASLLGDGKSSRLYHRLVYQRQLARSVGTHYDFLTIDPGLFYVYGQPMPGKSVQELERALLAEIESVQRGPVPTTELEKVKNALEAAFLLAQDSLFYQALVLGQYEIAERWQRVDDYVPGIRAVSAEDVQRVARQYLVPDNRTVATLDPLPIAAGKRPPRNEPFGRQLH